MAGMFHWPKAPEKLYAEELRRKKPQLTPYGHICIFCHGRLRAVDLVIFMLYYYLQYIKCMLCNIYFYYPLHSVKVRHVMKFHRPTTVNHLSSKSLDSSSSFLCGVAEWWSHRLTCATSKDCTGFHSQYAGMALRFSGGEAQEGGWEGLPGSL